MSVSLKLRRIASPLNVFCSVGVKAGEKYNTDGGVIGVKYCPLTQTYDADKKAYEVSRADAPTVIVPAIYLTAVDGSVSYDNTSPNLTNIRWWAQRNDESSGRDISTIAEWNGYYTIVSTGTERGAISITKDLPTGMKWTLWMTADFDDERTGYTVVVPVISKRVTLLTLVNTESQYTMIIDRENGEVYNPLTDLRLLHEYKVTNGIESTLEDDGKTYLRTLNVKLNKGRHPADGFSIKVERISNGEYFPADNREVNSITGTSVVFDLRWMTTATYRISCVKDGKVLASKMWGYVWSNDTPEYKAIGSRAYAGGESLSYVCQVSYRGARMPYPEAYLDISWATKDGGNVTQRGGGSTVTLPQSVIAAASSVELICSVVVRGVIMAATDEDNNLFVDENNNVLTI